MLREEICLKKNKWTKSQDPNPYKPSYASRKWNLNNEELNETDKQLKEKKGEQPLYLKPFFLSKEQNHEAPPILQKAANPVLADIWWVLSSLFTGKDSFDVAVTSIASLPVQQWV